MKNPNKNHKRLSKEQVDKIVKRELKKRKHQKKAAHAKLTVAEKQEHQAQVQAKRAARQEKKKAFLALPEEEQLRIKNEKKAARAEKRSKRAADKQAKKAQKHAAKTAPVAAAPVETAPVVA